ncbi:MAG TPA: hypothetical protein PK760_00455, partial [Flavobacteriales bacterium]|nr:hypothetical protein [Flavobacteriales bacterium]
MRFATLLLAFVVSSSLLAEHLPGGNLTYRCVGTNQYEITLQLWRECSGAPMVAQDLHFESLCGVVFDVTDIPLIQQQEVSPVCPDQQLQTTCNGGTLIGIEQYTYRTTLFLSQCSQWTISWNTCCRNVSINLLGAQGLYIEAQLNNAGTGCFDSPSFSQALPPYVCVDQPVSYDPGVVLGADQ